MDALVAERSIISGTSYLAAGSPMLRRLEGIVLHVDEYCEQPPETLVFRKDRSRTIAVGRKSGAVSGHSQDVPADGLEARNDDKPQSALFRCPVVSRKHAKITFTEYGNVRRSPTACPLACAKLSSLLYKGIHH